MQILQSTSDRRLDDAALKCLRQWRFKPHTLEKLVMPIGFGR